jgi:uncharacterized delta-60 repeat protein
VNYSSPFAHPIAIPNPRPLRRAVLLARRAGSLTVRLPRSIAAVAAVAVLATALLATSTASAAVLGSLDGEFGNEHPYARLAGPGDSLYNPGGIAALPGGGSLVAEANSRLGLTRLTPEGAPDPAFGTAGTATIRSVDSDNSEGSALAIAANGDYLVVGTAAAAVGEQLAVAEFTSEEVEGKGPAGSLDSSFASGSGHAGLFEYSTPVQQQAPSATIGKGIAVAPDGTILAVGTEYIGTPSEPAIIVVRITPDGSAEELFTGLQGDGQPTTAAGIALGSNGEIYVAGTENPGTPQARAVLATLTRRGFPAHLELDTSFGTSGELTSTLGGSSAELATLAVASDGDVLVGGQVDAGAQEGVVARVTPSGSLDPTFGSGGVVALQTNGLQTPMSFVKGIVTEPDGAPVIAGDTGQIEPPMGLPKSTSFVAQLTASGAPDSAFDPGAAQPGVTFEPPIGGYTAATVAGLAIDEQGRLLVASETSSSSPAAANEGLVERFQGYAPPQAAFSAPSSVTAGAPATFDGSSSSDGAGTIADYAWDLDGSKAFATDGATSPTIQHTFTTPGTVTVSLRVTNTVGQVSTATEQVTVHAPAPARIPGPIPRVVLNTTSLSFAADINSYNQTYIDSNPQAITVTNGGTAPLALGAVKIVDSAGGFVISNHCVPTLSPAGFAQTCTQDFSPADTCSNTTLQPGAQCSVAVQYQEAGRFGNATGKLEIDSNAASSPDLVALSATATFITGNPGIGPIRCPGDLNGLGGKLEGCWFDSSGAGGAESDTWATFTPVTLDGQVTLAPTSPGEELFYENGTLSATPGNGRYTIEVSNTSAPPAIPVGSIDLGTAPYVCAYNGRACANNLPISNPNHYTIHGLEISGGEVLIGGGYATPATGTVCSSAASFVYARLPKLFSSAPVKGAQPPTATFQFGGCTNATGPVEAPPGQENDTGEPAPVTCPNEKVPTPNCNGHKFYPPRQLGLRAGTARTSAHAMTADTSVRARAADKSAHAGPAATSVRARAADTSVHARMADASDDGASGPCPEGDVNYTDSIQETFVQAMDFGTPYLCYDPDDQIWTAGGTFNILDATINTGEPPEYGISFTSNGHFVGGGIKEVNAELPLVPPVFLTSFGGQYHTEPTRLQAHATVEVAHLIKLTGGAFAVWANPQYPYSYPSGCDGNACPLPGVSQLHLDTSGKNALTAFAAGASGEVELKVPVINSVKLASAYVFYYSRGYFEFAGCLGQCGVGLSFLGLSVRGEVDGQVNTANGQYNLEGAFKACVNWPIVNEACLGVKGVVSSAGIGGCASINAFGFEGSVFARYPWGGSVEVNFGCELEPVTVAVQASAARAAQASHAISLNLPGHTPATTIHVKGDGGPPGLSLSGPDGAHLSETDGATGVHTRDLVIWPEPKLDETLVGIMHPARGAWTITPLAGSTPITKVSYVNALAPPKISTTVSGQGRARTLAYRVRPRAGQQVTFAERANGVFHVLGKASGTHGVLHFTPASGVAGEREVEALITLSGSPAPAIIVGHYQAPAPPSAGKPSRVRLARGAGGLRITWGAAAQASAYLVTVSLSDGRRASFKEPAHTLRVTVPALAASTSAEVGVRALTSTGAVGPAAVARLKSTRGPGQVHGLKVTRSSKGVVIQWRAARGAKLYLVRARLGGSSQAAPVFVSKPRFISTGALAQMGAGSVATVTVTALAASGEQGPASSVRYRARTGSK